MKVNYHVLNSSIVLNFNGKTLMLAETDSRFQKVLELISAGRIDEIPAVVDIVSNLKKKGIDVVHGSVLIDGDLIPDSLGKRILDYDRKNLPFDSLVLFWKNLKKNPSFNSRLQLFKFLEHNGHPLTEDGCFIAYRGITEDWKDKYTGTMDNSIGSVVEMNRSEVDDNPNNTCSSGLHAACHSYAKDFADKVVIVKVNPSDVVAVPTDYNGTKMRVSKFEVVDELKMDRPLDSEETPLYTQEEDESVDCDDDDCNECEFCGSYFCEGEC